MNKKYSLKILYSPIFFGIITGSLAVLAQPLLKIYPPQAYGICTVCHARDLVNWLSNLVFSRNFESAEVASNLPLLTTIGIITGSFLSSKFNSEYKLVKIENPIKMFFLGIIISIFGLLIMSCPTRLFLRFSFGDPFSFIAILGLFLGIFLGVLVLKRSI